MIVGTIGAAAIGTAMPSFAFLWGNMTNTFGNSDSSLVEESKKIMIQFILIGVGAFVAGWLMYACWMIAG
jgi:ATP-binding cassette, subfamily B (MDR/TAP), member 1